MCGQDQAQRRVKDQAQYARRVCSDPDSARNKR
jgi:hypothetical protein